MTEYHYTENTQLSVQVDLFTEAELQDQIRGLLRDYRHFHFHKDDMEPSEQSDYKKKSDRTLDLFKAMFRGRLRHEDELVAHSEATVLEKLISWARELRPADHMATHAGLTVEQCASTLSTLSTEPPSRREAAAWPYIKTIKYVKFYV